MALQPVGAAHCESWSTTEPNVAGIHGDVAGRYYVHKDYCYPGTCPFPWIYQESNGIPGLQRGDEMVDDTCHGMIEPDTVVF